MLHRLWGLCALCAWVVSANAEGSKTSLELLHRAVEYYQVQGNAALAAFSRQGKFVEPSRYVFVIDTAGVMLASGGPSIVLVGRNVTRALPSELQQAFRSALRTNGSLGVQHAEYRWRNWSNGRTERRSVYFQRVDNRIIAVTEAQPHATAQQAANFLERSVEEIKRDPLASVDAINSLSSRFQEDDLYLFVIDLNVRRYIAHGYNLRLLGTDFALINDPDGRPVGKPILDLMRVAEAGRYDYRWKNPVTAKVEEKHALLQRVGHYLVATGYYDASK